MSLKKRMFRSNMTILFLALIGLVLVVLLVLVLFEDAFEKQFDKMEYTGDAEIIENTVTDPSQNSEDVSGSKNNTDDSGQITEDKHGHGKDRSPESLAFEKEIKDWAKQTVHQSFFLLLLVLFIICICAVGVLLGLSAIFTRRMNRLVMEPLDLLVAGATRIQNGNLNEKIEYHGEEELEHVCDTFNTMQETILADKEQRIRYEKARTDMVTGISHDLRTPLTSIQGYIKGVLDGVANTDQKKELYLKTAYESTEEMNILLQKLFDFSRMESGQMPFSFVPVDLAEYTNAYLAQKELVYEKEQVTFAFESDGMMPETKIDVEQVRRIFDNLLENSLKYADVSPVSIQVSCKVTETERMTEENRENENMDQEKTKRYVELIWKDNGAGVPEDKLPHLFERFYRCDEARNKKGSGVGLYVVKYIMEQQNGFVTAENENGLKLHLYFEIV